MPIACIDLFIIKNNKLLLGKRINRPFLWKWCFPWWRILIWEKQKDAVQRKLKEEIWFNIQWNKNVKTFFLWVYDTIFNENAFENWLLYHTINNIYVIYIDNVKDFTIHLDSQHNAYKRFDIKQNITFPVYINTVIWRYLAWLSNKK
jgi:hypothetical protein